MSEGKGEILLYQTADMRTRIQVLLHDQTLWLTQLQMADLFQTSVPNINIHIRNIFDEGELREVATIKEYLIVRQEGARQVSRAVAHYNLDVIISVGYRVKSQGGTQFRIWATERLREFIVKGFVMDDERLKDGRGQDFFDELLERIRAIRASERRFYQKIMRDIYATSIDYDAHATATQTFFATVQSKLHYCGRSTAIPRPRSSNCAAERQPAEYGFDDVEECAARRDPQDGRYDGQELSDAGRIERTQPHCNNVSRIMPEEQLASNRRQMTMADWAKKLDGFLAFNEKNILTHAGKITAELAGELALKEFEKITKPSNAGLKPNDRPAILTRQLKIRN